MCYADADTLLFRAAILQQEDYIEAVHKETGWKKRFKNVTSFYGRGKARDGGWIAEQNEKREKDGKPLISANDFELIQGIELKGSEGDHEKALHDAMTYLDYNIGMIKKAMDSEDYRLVIGGEGNYRHDYAQRVPYKGSRKEKPILFLEIKEQFLSKYKNKVIVSDGIEAEDYVARMGYISSKEQARTGKWPYLISFIDKDVKQVYCPYLNYDKLEEGIQLMTPIECMRHFTKQLILGDATDDIEGINTLPEEIYTKYSIRKVKTVGETTSVALLASCTTVKEMFERVVEVYKASYGEEPIEFVSHRNEKLSWTWLDFLKETAILVYLQRHEDERYDIEDTLKKLKVDY